MIRENVKEKCELELPEGASTNHPTNLKLAGLALDNSGNLLIGSFVGKESYICTYTQDMVRLKSIKIHLQPQYLAVTPTNAIVISSTDSQRANVQVINHKGTLLHTLTPPDGVTTWWPRGVCCTEGMILVANNASTAIDTGIYCYSISGQYLDCITNDEEVSSPMGLAVTDNDRTLMVAESGEGEGVKVFKRDDSECLVGRSKHDTISDDTELHVFQRETESYVGVNGYTHSSNNFELKTTKTVTVRRNNLMTITPSTIKYETVSGVSLRKKQKHQESYTEPGNSESPDNQRDSASHVIGGGDDDDDDDDDTFDLTTSTESPSKQITENIPVSLEAPNSSRSYENVEAPTNSQRTNAERKAVGFVQASHGSNASLLRNISDNLDWLESL